MSDVMNKTETVRARMTPETKIKAGKILEEYGMSHSTFINLSYHALLNGEGIPISKNVPNAETVVALNEPRKNLKSYDSVDDMFEDIEKND
jgi:addiction module RelB/DinJ family antitoxin